MARDHAIASGSELAIIGMAGRFPGAPDVTSFWHLLRDGVDAGTELSDDDLRRAGVSRELSQHPDYVRRAYSLDDVEAFDAPLFGFSALEARLIDPQQRVFLECAHQALDDAGRGRIGERDRVGVFGGSTLGMYLLHNVLPARASLRDVSDWQIGVANDKDCLASRVSYKLNLRGPSVTVQTTCSTSLVAVHLACQSLLNHECDMALAGGVSIRLPQLAGYRYRAEELLSRDGRCRAFDRRATGTVFGSGAGVVVLKRLADAVRDRDAIRALLLGSAVNNDGGRKVGFTAPSEDGQAQVVATALALAAVDSSTIQYVEAHGTGTIAGDPIEMRALRRAFQSELRDSCALGSVKTNIGHLDAAAGIAGLIKTVLALEHRMIPKTLHFDELNPDIELSNTPFFVNRSLREWRRESTPRRASVSSFGVGGTNAHVILQEAPPIPPPSLPSARDWHLLPVSARTDTALADSLGRLRGYLEQHPNVALADVAFTLQNGRKSGPSRRAVLCRDVTDALAVLGGSDPARLLSPEAVAPRQSQLPAGTEALSARADVWLSGKQPEPSDEYLREPRARVHLPAYPFERQRHWIDAPQSGERHTAAPRTARSSTGTVRDPSSPSHLDTPPKQLDLSSWFYLTAWRESPMPVTIAPTSVAGQRWLVLADQTGLARGFADWLREMQADVEFVEREQLGSPSPNCWRGAFHGVAHFFALDPLAAPRGSLQAFDEAQAQGFYALLRALQGCGIGESEQTLTRVLVVGDSLLSVAGEAVCAEKSTVIALSRVLAQEHPRITCRVLDVDSQARANPARLLHRIAREFEAQDTELVIAYRGARRLLHGFSPHPLAPSLAGQGPFRAGGTYLVTGGLGRVGFQIARHLLTEQHAKVVVSGRTELGCHAPAEAVAHHAGSDGSRFRALLSQAARQLQLEQPMLRFEPDGPLRGRLDRLCAAYVAKELRRGNVGRDGQRFPLAALAHELRITPSYQRLFDFFVSAMREEQLLEVTHDGFAVWSDASAPEPAELRRSLAADYPALSEFLEVLERCATSHRSVLAGHVSALEVLFPRGDTMTTARALESALQYSTLEACRALLSRVIVLRCKAAIQAAPLRILEIGAGNGLLTRPLAEALRCLDAGNIEYLVTDIGSSFVKQAERELPPLRYPFLRFGTFDITRAPQAQGLALGSFDLIVGLDVLHVVPSLRPSLRHLRSLLSPTGALGLLEAVQTTRYLNMVWGTTRQWWQFDDEPDRTGSPLVSLSTWQRIVTEEGYDAACYPRQTAARAESDYGLILAWPRDAMVRTEPRPLPSPASPRQEKAARLATLRGLGGQVHYCVSDIASESATRSLIDETIARFGPLDGIIHAAGDAGINDVLPLARLSVEDCEKQLLAKAKGLLCLAHASVVCAPSFVLAMSSNASVLGGPGLAAYAAANQFVDAFVSCPPEHATWFSANWDGWPAPDTRDLILESSMGEYAMNAAESMDALQRVVMSGATQVVVSTGDLAARATALQRQCQGRARGAPRAVALPRALDYGDRSEVESALAALWGELLGSPPVALDDNFFDLGGDSIIGVRMVASLKERFDVELPTSSLFDAPTVRGLAQHIVRGHTKPEDEVAGSMDRGARRRARSGETSPTRNRTRKEDRR